MFDRFLNIMLLWSPLEPFKVDILIPLITWFDISFFCFGSGGAGYCFWLFSLIISTLNFGLNSTGVFAFFLLSFITAYLAKSLKNMYLYPNVTISLACSMVVNIINLILTNLGPKYFNSVFFMLNFVFFFYFYYEFL